MASYLEIADILQNQEYKRRATVAVLIKANGLLDSPIESHKLWASNTVAAGLSSNIGAQMVRKFLAENSSQSLSFLTNTLSNDSAMQTQANLFVDNLLTAG
jgi:hypothetical protein